MSTAGAQPLKVRGLGHVSLTVASIDRATEFYRDVLGMNVTERKRYEDERAPLRQAIWLRCGAEHHSLALFEMRDAEQRTVTDSALAPVPGLHHFAFEVDSFDDLVAIHRRVVDSGSTVVEQTQFGPGSHVRIYCLDPDGHRVEIYWDLDLIGWDGSVRDAPKAEAIDLQNFDLSAFRRRKEAS